MGVIKISKCLLVYWLLGCCGLCENLVRSVRLIRLSDKQLSPTSDEDSGDLLGIGYHRIEEEEDDNNMFPKSIPIITIDEPH